MEINIKGGEELSKALKQLSPKIEKNIMRAALRAGAKVIADEAKRNVPEKSGELKKSIRSGSKATRQGQVIATAKAGNDKAWYWRFVEFGTQAHLIMAKNQKSMAFGGVFAKQIEHPGATARPFMRPALDAKAQEAIQKVADVVRQRLTKEGINVPDVEPDIE